MKSKRPTGLRFTLLCLPVRIRRELPNTAVNDTVNLLTYPRTSPHSDGPSCDCNPSYPSPQHTIGNPLYHHGFAITSERKGDYGNSVEARDTPISVDTIRLVSAAGQRIYVAPL